MKTQSKTQILKQEYKTVFNKLQEVIGRLERIEEIGFDQIDNKAKLAKLIKSLELSMDYVIEFQSNMDSQV